MVSIILIRLKVRITLDRRPLSLFQYGLAKYIIGIDCGIGYAWVYIL